MTSRRAPANLVISRSGELVINLAILRSGDLSDDRSIYLMLVIAGCRGRSIDSRAAEGRACGAKHRLRREAPPTAQSAALKAAPAVRSTACAAKRRPRREAPPWRC
ncbi:MAG TPA: hypothetical protein VL263_05095 [Vicinamibacterales bacterium]|nr:hypothetical protein [Vicinamibacterales bacterium]